MNDTTELIQALAQQVVTVMKQSLNQVTEPQAITNLAWIETALRDVLRQIGAETLGQWLSAAQGTPAAERPCECGGALRYQRYRPATVLSVWPPMALMINVPSMPVCTRERPTRPL